MELVVHLIFISAMRLHMFRLFGGVVGNAYMEPC
jgi:hypothetical protein